MKPGITGILCLSALLALSGCGDEPANKPGASAAAGTPARAAQSQTPVSAKPQARKASAGKASEKRYRAPREDIQKCRAAMLKTPDSALKVCYPPAEKGDPEAQYLVATIYGNAIGVREDFNKQVAWLNKAQNGGNLQAEVELGIIGIMIYTGNHVGNTGKQALFYLNDAKNRGSLKARTTLARLMGTEAYKDLGIYDPEKSHEELLALAKLGVPEAMILASHNYVTGFGTAINHHLAVKHLEAAAHKGIPFAYKKLAEIYLNNENFKNNEMGYAYFFAYTACDNSSDNMRTLDSLQEIFQGRVKDFNIAKRRGGDIHRKYGCKTYASYEHEEFARPPEKKPVPPNASAPADDDDDIWEK